MITIVTNGHRHNHDKRSKCRTAIKAMTPAENNNNQKHTSNSGNIAGKPTNSGRSTGTRQEFKGSLRDSGVRKWQGCPGSFVGSYRNRQLEGRGMQGFKCSMKPRRRKPET